MTTPGPETAPDAPEPAQADTDARERSARRDQIAKAVLDFHGRENPTVSDRALAYGTADAILNRVATEWWEHQCAAAVPADARETLRDRIADAIRDTMTQTSTDAAAAGTVSLISWSQLADAVLPVVEAALEEQQKRAAASWVNADYWRQRSKAAEVRVQETLARAEQAEDRARKNLDAIAEVVLLADEQQQRAVAAEALLQRMRDLLDSYPPGSNFARSGAQALFRRVLDQEAGQ